jgi:hypothetical protein
MLEHFLRFEFILVLLKIIIMVKTTTIPQETNYNLIIPSNYIGKKIEILFYALDELADSNNEVQKVKLSDKYKGTFTKEDATSFNEFTNQTRKEWDGI